MSEEPKKESLILDWVLNTDLKENPAIDMEAMRQYGEKIRVLIYKVE